MYLSFNLTASPCPHFSLSLFSFLIISAVYGNLPSEGQLADWEFAVSQHSAVPQGLLVSSYSCSFPFVLGK